MVVGQLSGLNDFKTETPYVQTQMAAIYEYWIAQAGFDGFRIDTVLEVDTGFWQSWCPAVHNFAATNNGYSNFFMFGEVENGSESTVGSYTGTEGGGAFKLDSTLDYPLYFTVNSVFATASGNTKQIEDHYNSIAANYDPAAQMRLVTFLDNHDQPRFLSSGNANGDTNRLAVGLEFLYTSRGIPCLYYGTEQAFNGTGDPNNREDMFAGQFKDAGLAGVDSFNMSHPLFQFVAKLNNFRRLYPALLTGTHANRWNTPGGPGLVRLRARTGHAGSFCRIQHRVHQPDAYQSFHHLFRRHRAGEPAQHERNHHHRFRHAADTASHRGRHDLQNLHRAQPAPAAGPGGHQQFARRMRRPNVPTFSPIVIQFSKPMNTNTVQSAFSLSPTVSGTFSWSAAHDTMTFTPGGLGLSPLTNISVTLSNTAVDAVSSNAFYAPYHLQFATAATSFIDPIPPSVTILSPTNGARSSGNLVIFREPPRTTSPWPKSRSLSTTARGRPPPARTIGATPSTPRIS